MGNQPLYLSNNRTYAFVSSTIPYGEKEFSCLVKNKESPEYNDTHTWLVNGKSAHTKISFLPHNSWNLYLNIWLPTYKVRVITSISMLYDFIPQR